MRSLREHANQTVRGSASSRYRKRRMKFFRKFAGEIGDRLKVIDIGGTFYHWKDEPDLLARIELTLINTEEESEELPGNVHYMKADARELYFIKEQDFDIAYSNSVIEHFSTTGDKKKIADDIMRIGKHYFVQTPNYYFPVEPHFLLPFFQMMPLSLQMKLVQKYSLGWYEKQTDEKSAEELVRSVSLLKLKELKRLFPGCKIYKEKFFLLNKSFIAYR